MILGGRGWGVGRREERSAALRWRGVVLVGLEPHSASIPDRIEGARGGEDTVWAPPRDRGD
ncbi:MAG: hypothetical protein CMJ84_17485 [Planctomycetes bacterium]|nr:hypothetical protein [Planctomycetota bacterium]